MTTINEKEIQKFSKLADEWWDANGKFKPLHKFNPIRISYIIDKCKSHFKLQTKIEKPLSSLKVLDIGCGGGLVCEPLSRLGAEVTGIDASSKNIEVAKIHAKKSNLKIKYFNTSPEKKEIVGKYDVILNLEIVEHVENLDLFLKSASELLEKNGIMFVATINRTFESYIKAIIGASRNKNLFEFLGIKTSLKNNFRASAIGCNKPKGPTTLGPCLDCIEAMIFLSA